MRFGISRNKEIDNLCAKVNREAEEERAKYRTPGSGQGETYRIKEQEARNVLDDEGPAPFLEAEAEATGQDVYQLAAKVIEKSEEWARKAPLIEAKRVSTNAAIKSAATVEEARELANIDWSEL